MIVCELIEKLMTMPQDMVVAFNAQGRINLSLNGSCVKAEVRDERIVVMQVVQVRVPYTRERPGKRSVKTMVPVVMLNPTMRQLDDRVESRRKR